MDLTLEESSRRLGHLRWAEMRLFEVLGAWVPSTEVAGAQVMLDRHSFHAAWRAEQWWERLPVLADVDREQLVRPPSDAVEACAAELAAAPVLAARLAGAYRVALPRMASAYRAHRALTAPLRDGPVVRSLDRVEADLCADWLEGESFLHRFLDSRGKVEEAAAMVSRLELLLVASAAGAEPSGQSARATRA